MASVMPHLKQQWPGHLASLGGQGWRDGKRAGETGTVSRLSEPLLGVGLSHVASEATSA